MSCVLPIAISGRQEDWQPLLLVAFSRQSRRSMRWLFGCLIAAHFPLTAAAHDLGAEFSIEGDRVRVVAYYDEDVAAADASVVVLDQSKNELHRGNTDAKGAWTFPRPTPGI